MKTNRGFTIIELLVVIVVIGVLAAITIVSFTGISQRAIIATLQSDLTNASNQLNVYKVSSSDEGYPDGLDCSSSPANNTVCLKSSGSNSFTYTPYHSSSPKNFVLCANNGSLKYCLTNNSSSVAVAIDVPTLFMPTFGSVTSSGASLDASIVSNGNSSITEVGTCWGTSPNPTTNCSAIVFGRLTALSTPTVASSARPISDFFF